MIYLNKEKKNNLLLTAFAGANLGGYADMMNFLTADEKRRLKASGTNCRKVFESVTQRLTPEQCKSLKNQLNHNELAIIAKTVKPEMNASFIDSVEDIYTLAEFAISECNACQQGEKLVNDCTLRKVLLRLDVPIAREPSQRGECPYSINEV